MAYWIEVHAHEGRMLGSDSTVPVDGRYGLTRAIMEGHRYIGTLKNIKPHITGFMVMRGTKPSDLKPVTKLIPKDWGAPF